MGVQPGSVLVVGARGRMGQATVRALEAADDLRVHACVNPGDNLEAALEAGLQAVVDFTTPDVVERHLEAYIRAGVCPVIGTTGLAPLAFERLATLARERRLGGVVAPNFAIGAILMMDLARRAARHLPDVEIVESHHPAKKDAPSGTALKTAQQIEEVTAASVPIHSVRLPGFLARQEVVLGGMGERLTISHDTLDRTCYMPGVLLACRKVPLLQELRFGLESLLDDGGAATV